jgi:hypothetical protein
MAQAKPVETELSALLHRIAEDTKCDEVIEQWGNLRDYTRVKWRVVDDTLWYHPENGTYELRDEEVKIYRGKTYTAIKSWDQVDIVLILRNALEDDTIPINKDDDEEEVEAEVD